MMRVRIPELEQSISPTLAGSLASDGKRVVELTILMPCLNEARTVGTCVRKAALFLREHEIAGEIVVADNGSTDGSQALAEAEGARVVPVQLRGYGAALAEGIAQARGRFVIMGDADDSYDFGALENFVTRLRAGDELVMGNRFRGGIRPGAMPALHRYFGNPFLTAIGRRFFGNRTCGDFYCGLRGFNRDAVRRLNLQSKGMEFALEMLIRAGMAGLRISEVPTTLSPDGRGRPPHLRWFRDGWRSMRLYLVLSPRWLFAVPGLALLLAGSVAFGALILGPQRIGQISFDYHTLMYAAAAVILGYQAVLLGAIAKLVAVETGLHPPVTRLRFLEERNAFEKLCAAGGLLATAGLGCGIVAVWHWHGAGFGDLTPTTTLRWVATSVLFLILGGQTVLAGCLLALINMVAERGRKPNWPIPEKEDLRSSLLEEPEHE